MDLSYTDIVAGLMF